METDLLSLKWNNHPKAFSNVLSKLCFKEYYSDATIVCQGKHFPVHKLVLSTCSKHFEDIFSATICKHPFIIISELKIEEMESLLKYMYEGEVNVPQSNLPRLIKAAEILNIRGLAVDDNFEENENIKEGKRRKKHKSIDSKRKSQDRIIEDNTQTIIHKENLFNVKNEENSDVKKEPTEKEDDLYENWNENEFYTEDDAVANLTENSLQNYSSYFTLVTQNQRSNTEYYSSNTGDPSKENPENRQPSNSSIVSHSYFGKIYQCNLCAYKTGRKTHFVYHLRKHTGEKPFICQICLKKFSLKHNLDRHMIGHKEHGKNIDNLI